jgi:hypothetical protein
MILAGPARRSRATIAFTAIDTVSAPDVPTRGPALIRRNGARDTRCTARNEREHPHQLCDSRSTHRVSFSVEIRDVVPAAHSIVQTNNLRVLHWAEQKKQEGGMTGSPEGDFVFSIRRPRAVKEPP